jgi:glycine cleavage system H lipoate-binding protein/ABC-type phosphate transport system substrate-binding protein
MKRTIILLINLLLINYSIINSAVPVTEVNSATGDSIRIISTPDLYNLSITWANEYNRLNPAVKVKVITVEDTKMTDNLLKEGNIGFVSNEFSPELNNKSLVKVVVGRDIIVPIMNSKNPEAEDISLHGISTAALIQLLTNTDSRNWGTLLNNSHNTPIHFYWINDASIATDLTEYLNTDKKLIKGIEVKSGEEMISAIKNDPYAVGFCKMVNILDFKTQGIIENIKLLPIDRNGNNKIDYNEKIYDDFNVFSRGVWIGKYPKTLFSSIYSVSSIQSETEMAFLKWVLTDGQQFLYGKGYSDLLVTERQTAVDKLYSAKIYSGIPLNNRSIFKVILLIISAIVIAGITMDTIVKYIRRSKESMRIPGNASQKVLDENSLVIPGGVYFDKTHTWVFMEQNGVVKVGIDDFLQHITGTITRIKMKGQGESVKKGEQILSIIQNGKQLNLYAPISGVIREQNKILDTNSSVINSSPYNEGWIYKIEPTNWLRENQLLFMADKQKRFIKNEFSRLKDFLAMALTSESGLYPQVVLQDGGELRDGTLSNLGPEIWEDFQTKFIDPSRQIWFYEIF